MDPKRALLRHLLATIAYRTQKALRDAPESFGAFDAGSGVRTPADLVRHMTAVMGYARSCFGAGRPAVEPTADLAIETVRLHSVLADVSQLLESGATLQDATEEQLLQGPFADALTHAGQLAMLRRLAGSPVARENFVLAPIDSGNVGPAQSIPSSRTGRD
jgi:hypothetical protein